MDPLASLRQSSLRQLESLLNAQSEIQRLSSELARRRREASGLVVVQEQLIKPVIQLREELSHLEGGVVQDIQSLQGDVSRICRILADRLLEKNQQTVTQSIEIARAKERIRVLEEESQRMNSVLGEMRDYEDIKSERKKSLSELQLLRRNSSEILNELEVIRSENQRLRVERTSLLEQAEELKVETSLFCISLRNIDY